MPKMKESRREFKALIDRIHSLDSYLRTQRVRAWCHPEIRNHLRERLDTLEWRVSTMYEEFCKELKKK